MLPLQSLARRTLPSAWSNDAWRTTASTRRWWRGAGSTSSCWPPPGRVPRLLASFSTSRATTCSSCLSRCGTWRRCWHWRPAAPTPQRQPRRTGTCSSSSSCATSPCWRASSSPSLWTTSPPVSSAGSPAARCARSRSAAPSSKGSLSVIAAGPDAVGPWTWPWRLSPVSKRSTGPSSQWGCASWRTSDLWLRTHVWMWSSFSLFGTLGLYWLPAWWPLLPSIRTGSSGLLMVKCRLMMMKSESWNGTATTSGCLQRSVSDSQRGCEGVTCWCGTRTLLGSQWGRQQRCTGLLESRSLHKLNPGSWRTPRPPRRPAVFTPHRKTPQNK